MERRRGKWDALGRRTDKVKPWERRKMERLKLRENLSDLEIAKRLGRDPRTVHKQLELAGQGKENSAKTTVLDTAQQRQLIQKWRIEIESYSPRQLLQRWLDEASAEGLGNFFADKDTKRLYHEAKRPHFTKFKPKRLYLQVESDPVFRLLRLKFPTSAVWSALEAWGEQAVAYLSTFYDMLYQAETLFDLALDVEPIDNGNLSVFIMKRKMERLYAVLVTCDLLTRGSGELPDNVRWALLFGDLEILRVRVNLELSSLTKRTRKGGWSTANLIEQIWADPQDHSGLVQGTRSFSTELVQLQSVQDSLAIALAELESKI